MAAWRSMEPDWFETEPDPDEERYARLEALIDEVGEDALGGFYEEWDGLSVDSPLTNGAPRADRRPLTERPAA